MHTSKNFEGGAAKTYFRENHYFPKKGVKTWAFDYTSLKQCIGEKYHALLSPKLFNNKFNCSHIWTSFFTAQILMNLRIIAKLKRF